MPTQLQIVAHHEAGHCVAALRLGRPLRDAQVWESGNGQTRYKKGEVHYCKNPSLEHVRGKMTDLMAGQCAEFSFVFGIRHVSRFRYEVDFHREGGDFEQARVGAWLETSLGGPPPVVAFRQAVDRAIPLVRDNWLHIQVVASQLYKKRAITEARVSEIINLVDLFGPRAMSL